MKLSRTAIKTIAMVTMLFNHIANVFLVPHSVPYEILTDIGYFTAVTICCFLVEGFHYTRSRRKYGLRLFVFAVISQFPFDFAFSGGSLRFTSFNMMVTLFICFLICEVLEHVSFPPLRLFIVLLLTALTLFCDWMILAPLFTVLFWWAGEDRKKRAIAFVIGAITFGLLNYWACSDLFDTAGNLYRALGNMAGILAAGAVVVFCYRGGKEKHAGTLTKYAFYVFYPAHLLVLGGIAMLMRG